MAAHSTIARLANALRGMERWMDRAQAYADAKKFETKVLLHARLAPDQFSFLRQVQAACDTATFAAAKLAGVEPPSQPDTETTFEDLRARLLSCVAYLETFGTADFAGSDERPCAHSWMQGKSMRGADYLAQFVVPNFYFHAATAYDILRHNGVELAKRDYLGRLSFI